MMFFIEISYFKRIKQTIKVLQIANTILETIFLNRTNLFSLTCDSHSLILKHDNVFEVVLIKAISQRLVRIT